MEVGSGPGPEDETATECATCQDSWIDWAPVTAEKWFGREGEEEAGLEEAIGEYVGNHPENDPTKTYLYYFNKIGLEEERINWINKRYLELCFYQFLIEGDYVKTYQFKLFKLPYSFVIWF